MVSVEQSCTKSSCFFCIMEKHDTSNRRIAIKEYLKGIPFLDDEELILVVSELWNVAMTRPDDDFPCLGIFECMACLINKAVHDKSWLLKHQNIYIPYYAAHIVGSYTMNRSDHATRAVDSGVIPPLLDLLRGKMSWVEQRVAIRALGHLASYEKTFKAIAVYEDEMVRLAIQLASSCVDEVYVKFVGIKERLQYHRDLLTRGVAGVEAESRKAEEWAGQMQCWSIHLLNCFAVKERSLDLMCSQGFLNTLCGMWGGLANHTSPAGVGLIRILCHNRSGRESISRSRHVVESLCNLSRSADDWQYMGIDCLLLLLKDPNTRYKVLEASTSYLVDLVELRSLGRRANVGEAITKSLIHNYKQYHIRMNADVRRWLVRRRRERGMSSEEVEGKRVIAKLIKQQGNHKFSMGKIEEAALKYSEALEVCPIRLRNERIVLYSSRAQCHLVSMDPDGAISDTTRALSLSTPPNSHANSLWIRSQAYDMKGMAKESLMDCIIFINVCIRSKTCDRLKVPYYAVRMITKQMEATWLFRGAAQTNENGDEKSKNQSKNNIVSGLSTILEEPFAGRIKMDRRNKTL